MVVVNLWDFNQAEGWLRSHSKQAAFELSSRAVFRSFSNVSRYEGEAKDLVILKTLRALFISVSYTFSEVDRKAEYANAAQAAASSLVKISKLAETITVFNAINSSSVLAHAVSSSSRSHSFVIRECARALSISAAKSETRLKSVLADAEDNHGELRTEEIWLGASLPKSIRQAEQVLVDFFSRNENWAFWARWYQEMWAGTFRDWDLAAEVALLPDDLWEGDDAPAKVAKAIRGLEAQRVAEATQLSETLVWDDETDVFRVAPPTVSNEQRLTRHLSRVNDALDDMIALGGGNGMTANTAEFRIIKRLVEHYSADPERVAFDLTDVNRSIRRQITVGEYGEDEPLRLLQAANTACIAFVCETHEQVAEELARGFEPEPQAVPEEDALVLKEAWRISEALLDQQAQRTTQEDRAEIFAGQIIDASVDPMPEWSPDAHALRSVVLRRQISRLWQQAQGFASIPGLAEKYDSDHSKAAGYISRVGFAAMTLHQAILILGRLLGFL